jgi:hypothetical protein
MRWGGPLDMRRQIPHPDDRRRWEKVVPQTADRSATVKPYLLLLLLLGMVCEKRENPWSHNYIMDDGPAKPMMRGCPVGKICS